MTFVISYLPSPSAKPGEKGEEDTAVASWELRVEGRLLDDVKVSARDGQVLTAALAFAASFLPLHFTDTRVQMLPKLATLKI